MVQPHLVHIQHHTLASLRLRLGLPPDADGIGNYAFFDAANYALIQITGGATAITIVQINRSHTNEWGVKREIMPKIMLASGGRPKCVGSERDKSEIAISCKITLSTQYALSSPT